MLHAGKKEIVEMEKERRWDARSRQAIDREEPARGMMKIMLNIYFEDDSADDDDDDMLDNDPDGR